MATSIKLIRIIIIILCSCETECVQYKNTHFSFIVITLTNTEYVPMSIIQTSEYTGLIIPPLLSKWAALTLA
ncbi:hypothetical protein XELAEV_18019434mg [Xenopus laevis]|uniref:Uncharacterized protein n=1 Tax=Xenopus laevis TaxID=8355 RepID=A0A974DFQ7_XENLA|nr:hypothetical protein XELAEV_18019434mg [Xenopus laevis]